MSIAIVILNWNGKQLLEEFLPSVVDFSKQATIYIADNASTDNSVNFVKQQYPDIKIIQNAKNEGYAGGYNRALQQVNETIFCLLNSDIEVTEHWLTPIIAEFNIDAHTAIIQPKILDYHNREYFEYAGAAGGFIDKFGYPYCRGRIFNTIEKDQGQYDDTSEIFWASGACLFIRNHVFKELGGFDEAFFAHMEEIDLCWRANSLGYTIKYVGASTIYHIGGATLQSENPKKTYLNFRNSLFTLTKNASGNLFWLLVFRLKLDGIAGIKFLFEFKAAHTMAIIRAHLSFYKHISRLLLQRNALRKKKNYYKTTSIVWSYFVNNKKYFNRL